MLVFFMALSFKSFWGLIQSAASGWMADKSPRLGAALSYYTVFAIPPLFVIVLFIASPVFDPGDVQSQLFSQVGGLVGEKSAEAIQSAMAAQYQNNKGMVASIIAIAMLLVTSTGFFIELQGALNTIWGVEAKPGQGIVGFIRNRLLSFAMVVGIGFLLMVSLVVSAALAAFGKYMSNLAPGLGVVGEVANAGVSFAVITALFAMIFKVLPDVKIAWRDVWVGAVVTSLLFTLGKLLLGLYLGKSSVVTAYGAAGSIVLILLWVYYSAQILFFGAEVTQIYANRFGKHLEPKKNARWVSCPDVEPETNPKARRPLSDRKAELVEGLREEMDSLRDVVER
jgi:membrane protein